MAASSRVRAKACARPPRLDPFCGCVLAVLLLAPNIDAARSGGGALSSDRSTHADLALRALAQLTPESADARTHSGRDLLTAAHLIDSINVKDDHRLGNIKDILEHLEDIRARLTSFRAALDPRHRQIRKILRDVEVKGGALKAMASKLEAEGQVDDGGDELPTQRDNICSDISKYGVDATFADMLQLFCEWLDGVRKKVNAREDEEPLAYSVFGLFSTLTKEQDYRQWHIGREIERVLGDERRWVSKHLAPRPAGTGNGLPSPEETKARLRRWAPGMWHAQIWEDAEGDTAATPLMALRAAQNTLASAAAEGDLTVGSVRERIWRLEVSKSGLAKFISSSDPASRERISNVLQEINARMDALRALAAQKLEAGEVDNRSELLPSQRDNICVKLESLAPEEDFREDVRKICETADRLHVIANVELDRGKGGFELCGRVDALRCRPGYSSSLVATELEHLIMEEWGWLFEQGPVVDA